MLGMREIQGYEPFGSLLPGRNYSSGSSRHLFQGQEHDDELYGSVGTSYSYEYRMHDPRIGRFMSIDPLATKYPWNSPYAFSENRVIDMVELEGLEAAPTPDKVPEAGPDGQGGINSGTGDHAGAAFKRNPGTNSGNAPPALGQTLTPPTEQTYKVSPPSGEQPVKNRQWGQVPDAEGPHVQYKQVVWTVNTSAQVTGAKSAPKLRVSTYVDPIVVSDGSKVRASSRATLYNASGDVVARKDLQAPKGSYFAPAGYIGAAEFDLVPPDSKGLLPNYRVSVTTRVLVEAHGSWFQPAMPGTIGIVPNSSSDSFIVAPKIQ